MTSPTDHPVAVTHLTPEQMEAHLGTDAQAGRILGILLTGLFMILLVMTIGVTWWTALHQATSTKVLG